MKIIKPLQNLHASVNHTIARNGRNFLTGLMTAALLGGLGPYWLIGEAMSRGGMIIYNWAIANPGKVAAIYGDAPVMDLRSWPGAGNKATLRAYPFKDAEEATVDKGYPVDNLKTLAKAGIPIIPTR